MLLCYFKLCVSFHNHQWIQTRVTVRKHPIWVKIGDFQSSVTAEFDRRSIGHPFHATLSFVHHFVAICKSKLELQSGNAKIGTKFALTSVTLDFDLWPWPFAWTSLFSMVITPQFSWWYDERNIVTDRQAERHLKTTPINLEALLDQE